MDAFYHQRRQHREQKTDRNYEYDENNDPDYLLALALSEELNGPGAASGVDQPYDSKKTFTDMLTVLKGENKAYDKTPAKRKSSAGFFTSSATSRPSDLASRTGEQPTRDVNYEPETSSALFILNTFSEFTHHIKIRGCNQCKEPFFASRLDVLTPFQNWMDGVVDRLSCTVRCKSCGTSVCIACTPEPFSKLSRSKIRGGRQEVSWCCVSGRLFLIWTLLCGFDSRLSESRKVNTTAKLPKPDPSPSHSRRGKRSMESYISGVGYGGPRYPQSYLPKGTGYNGHDEIDDYNSELDIDIEDLLQEAKGSVGDWEASPPPRKRKDSVPNDSTLKAQRAQMSEDRLSKLTLGFLTDLLPSLERETRFDYDTPTAVLEMLRGSKILNYCAELLRNDSLVDIVKRKDLYQNLFSFLNTLGSHPSTSEALFCPRSVPPEAIDLFTLSFCDEDPQQKESAPSLADGLQNLIAQSSLVLQSASNNQADFASDDGLTMLGICRQVLSLAEFIQANNPTHANGKEKSVDSAIPKELRFASVEEKQILPTYRFASDAKKLKTSQPGRFKRLIMEITTLQTSLPPGIFVRYCEDRPDILKCIIIGPAGTPYENGMFEFDIFCGAHFPDDPPKFSFKGTGGGKAAINPNLYSDGKVCLSLLGTWSGERWNPKTSTLLQVLVSIQAMILCAEPWYNEPGREADYNPLAAGTPSSRYNLGVRMDTVRWALLHHWLEDTPELWKDVVTYHFTTHGNDILKKVEEWANEAAKATKQLPKRRNPDFSYQWAFPVTPLLHDAEIASRAAADGLVSKLQEALKKYGATYKINYVPPPPGPPPPPTRPRSDSVSQFSPTWASYDFQMPEFSDFPDHAHEPDDLSFHPPPFAPDAGLGTMGGGSSDFGALLFGSALQPANPPSGPGPLIVSPSGPPSSNTRSAARGRGSSAEASSPRGRGGGTEMSSPRGRGSGIESSVHSGRGGSSQGPPLPTLGYGRGAGSFLSFPEETCNYTFADTTRGGRGGFGLGGFGRGRGRGRGDQGGRGGH